jgi:hypothetical protein
MSNGLVCVYSQGPAEPQVSVDVCPGPRPVGGESPQATLATFAVGGIHSATHRRSAGVSQTLALFGCVRGTG